MTIDKFANSNGCIISRKSAPKTNSKFDYNSLPKISLPKQTDKLKNIDGKVFESIVSI